jgi:hypothetical protein
VRVLLSKGSADADATELSIRMLSVLRQLYRSVLMLVSAPVSHLFALVLPLLPLLLTLLLPLLLTLLLALHLVLVLPPLIGKYQGPKYEYILGTCKHENILRLQVRRNTIEELYIKDHMRHLYS